MKQAACAEEPFDAWDWVVEPSGGWKVASTVIQRLEVCRRCPVRSTCLEDVLSEQRYTVVGVFGGSSMTERQRTRLAVVRDLNEGATLLDLGTDMSGRAFMSRDSHRFEAHDPEVMPRPLAGGRDVPRAVLPLDRPRPTPPTRTAAA